MNNSQRKYILITAAHNEQEFIEKTILSVINQSLKPLEWIIVNDGSIDFTEKIINKYLPENNFIKLINHNRKEGHDFSSKVFAINLGLNQIQSKNYEYIGILDADVAFEPNYYESLINELEKDATLGIVGGVYFDIIKNKKVFIKPSPYSIRGATQFFRRECFEQIGGLQPLKYGGEDALACYTARMYGWRIKNIENLTVIHLRPTGTKVFNIFRTRFREGMSEYYLGYHPVFQLLKCTKRLLTQPLFIGSLLRFFGYWWALITCRKNILSIEYSNFIKRDQINRLIHQFFNKSLSLRKIFKRL